VIDLGVPGIDAIGAVETRGVDFIPETERHSRPRELVWVFIAIQFCFGIVVLGQLPIAFGLDWWAAATSTVAGLLVGSILYAPFALLGTRTGTNSAVASGAFFGVVGRVLGSFQNLFIGIGFFALTIWTGGQAAVAGMHRLWKTPDSNGALVLAFVVTSIVCVLVATYGHANVVAVQRFVLPSMGILIIIGFIVFAPNFNAHFHHGPYILDSFWSTWLLSAVTAASLPISYAPFVNDYARYISANRWRAKSVVLAAFGSMFIGCAVALLFATYTATAMPVNVASWVSGLIQLSPIWYVVPIVLIAIVGSCSQGAVCIYGNGLDVSSIFPRLRRHQATVIIGAIGTGLVILGQYKSSVQSFAGAFLIVLVVVTTPWMFICLLGHFFVRGRYDAAGDFQVFNRGERGGRYWFFHGFNIAACAAWIPAMVLGLLFADTSIYVGPLANTFGAGTGGYICFVVAGGLALILYPTFIFLMPSQIGRTDDVVEDVTVVSPAAVGGIEG
jgi:purine-cytosine permease-like protein